MVVGRTFFVDSDLAYELSGDDLGLELLGRRTPGLPGRQARARPRDIHSTAPGSTPGAFLMVRAPGMFMSPDLRVASPLGAVVSASAPRRAGEAKRGVSRRRGKANHRLTLWNWFLTPPTIIEGRANHVTVIAHAGDYSLCSSSGWM